jgi:Zn-dependent membrane protease YugP
MGSDFYDPTQKTLSLSTDVYSGKSISATAVAAHECGHAIQHAQAYSWLSLRSAMVPTVNFSNKISPFLVIGIIFGGFLVQGFMPQLIVAYIIVIGLTTLFTFITLPVEIDASRRALVWLETSNITSQGKELDAATDALKSAAYTYVVAALASLAYLLYWLGVFRD